MKPINIDELKKIELDILKCVAKFCDEKGIRYYLCGGTLLGAVRHKGFIPWDDDIDICMPRPDYLRFVKEFNGYDENYIVSSIENNPKHWQAFAKILDRKIYVDSEAERIPKEYQFMSIDCYPIDGLPKSRRKQKVLFLEQNLMHVLYVGASHPFKRSTLYDDRVGSMAKVKGYIRTVCKFIAIGLFRWVPRDTVIKIMNKNASRIPFEDADECACIVNFSYSCEQEKMPRREFEKRQKFIFEGEEFWGSCVYDLYLTNLYGDYMTPPPPEKRVTHHLFTAYRLSDE